MEGGYPAVRASNMYVLRDQSLGSEIKVIAIDNAGNMRTVVFGAGQPVNWGLILGIIVIVILFLFYFFKKRKK